MVDLISGYVTLKRSGQNLFGLCPFHNEKTPSFSVNPEKQIFRCFGCDAGGNVFTFLMRHEGIAFPDAVKLLAQRAGITLDIEQHDTGEAKLNEALYHINEFAATFFQKNLWEQQGNEALTYIRKRGLSDQTIKDFGIGYAPSGWDGLIKSAAATANDEASLLRAGLIIEKDGSNRRYDRFRDRLMFPIHNLSGRVVAFGGRILEDVPSVPKYINSPESSVYEKSKVLYGLYQNRDEIRRLKRAVIVEGYMDFLSLVAGGIKNVVATSGTALTEEQARLIRRYTSKVTLMYDSDSAGAAATLRGADVLIGSGLEVAVVSLPEDHDPDSFMRQFGSDAVSDQLEQAAGLFSYKVAEVMKKPYEERGQGIQEILESLARVGDRIQRSLMIAEIARTLRIDDKILWTELESVLQKQGQRNLSRAGGVGSRLNDLGKPGRQSRLDKAVEDLIRILLHNWEMAEFIFHNIELEEIEQSPKAGILKYLSNQFKGDRQPTEQQLLHHFTEVELTQFIVNEMHKEWPEVNFKRWATDCVKTIKIEQVQIRINDLRETIRTAEAEGHLDELLRQCKELEAVKQHLASF